MHTPTKKNGIPHAENLVATAAHLWARHPSARIAATLSLGDAGGGSALLLPFNAKQKLSQNNAYNGPELCNYPNTRALAATTAAARISGRAYCAAVHERRLRAPSINPCVPEANVNCTQTRQRSLHSKDPSSTQAHVARDNELITSGWEMGRRQRRRRRCQRQYQRGAGDNANDDDDDDEAGDNGTRLLHPYTHSHTHTQAHPDVRLNKGISEK